MIFEKYNKNPRNIKASDCVVRAIATALNQSWIQTYTDLCNLGADLCRMPNEPITYERYLKQKGFDKQKMPKREDNTRYTIKEFADELADINKVYIISVAKHLTVLGGITLVDTWNCSHKSVGNYWVVN